MKYCLRSRLAPRYLRLADEIKVDYRDRRSIPDVYHTYGKPIILFPPSVDEAYDWEEIRRYALFLLCENNFILNVNFIGAAHEAKRQGIKFMINTEATSYWDLKGLEELGVEYAYVGIPLFFNLEPSLDMDIKLRTIPTVAYNHNLPHPDGVCGQWIRPEDVEWYEGYIEVFEFEHCEVAREQALYRTYAENKKWNTRLDILVEDLGSPAVNRLILPEVVQTRLICRQRCQAGGNCHLCYTALKLADPDLFPKEKEKVIEKK